MQATTPICSEDSHTRAPPPSPCGPQLHYLVPIPTWNPGVNEPPFLTTNAEATRYLRAFRDGEAELSAGYTLSRAVCYQIYVAVLDDSTRAAELATLVWDDFYRIIVSLMLGKFVTALRK